MALAISCLKGKMIQKKMYKDVFTDKNKTINDMKGVSTSVEYG